MRHFEVQNGLAEIPNKGGMVGSVARCVHVRFDRRNQSIEALTHLCFFGLETVEFSAKCREGLS